MRNSRLCVGDLFVAAHRDVPRLVHGVRPPVRIGLREVQLEHVPERAVGLDVVGGGGCDVEVGDVDGVEGVRSGRNLVAVVAGGSVVNARALLPNSWKRISAKVLIKASPWA